MKLEDIGFYTLEDSRAENVSKTSPLWRCELLITSKCNFKCPYCRGTDKDADISYDEAKNIVKKWAEQGLKNIRFSGGEPTVVKWLPDIIKYAKDLGIERIAISTNGSQNYIYYRTLNLLGVTDFSISLDACCASYADKMAGVKGYFETICNNIKELSKITYVTVGCVFNETNYQQSLETVLLADKLGVADIRIISAAQYNKALEFVQMIPEDVIERHPILKYRVNNFKSGRNVRGINKCDNHKCPLILDDMAVKGNYHYPCIIKLREGCEPIGHINGDIREDRYKYYQKHNCYKDDICRCNCLDVCVDYNNKVKELNAEVKS